MRNLHWYGLLITIVVLSTLQPALAESTSIQVLSAVVRDQTIADANLILQKNGEKSASSTTDRQGNAHLASTFPDTEDTLLIIKKVGYSTLVVKCPCDHMSYAISPVMSNLDGLRVVLNWGAKPEDLDLHLAFPGNHIYWDKQTGSGGPNVDANLDIDHTTGYGPETITVEKKHLGETYVFAVHDYTNRESPEKTELSRSRAKVLVYVGQSLVRSYYVPSGIAGNLWTVFRISGDGEFQDINTLTRTEDDAANVLGSVSGFIDGSTTVEVHAASTAAAQSATQLNRNGEAAYHAGDLDGAAEFFRQAVESNPNYGQAYSNLGLAYQKIGRTSEAIWANRKAISLASGNTAPTVRASSYYNIARIYEAVGQFDDALRNYQAAKLQKENPVYDTAIERVRAASH